MSDLLIKLSGSRFGAGLVKQLGLPAPVELARSAGPYMEQPLAGKNILLGRSQNGYAIDRLWQIARDAGAVPPETADARPDILVMDATGCASPPDYRALYDFFHPQMRAIARTAIAWAPSARTCSRTCCAASSSAW